MPSKVELAIGTVSLSLAIILGTVVTKKTVDCYHKKQIYSQIQQVAKEQPAVEGSILHEYCSIPAGKVCNTAIGMLIAGKTSLDLLLIPPTEDTSLAVKMAYASTTQSHDCDSRHNTGRDYFVLYADGHISDFALNCIPVGPATACTPSKSNFTKTGDTEVWEFGHVVDRGHGNNGYLKIKTERRKMRLCFPCDIFAISVAGNGNSTELFGSPVEVGKIFDISGSNIKVNVPALLSMELGYNRMLKTLGEIKFEENAYNYTDCVISQDASKDGIFGKWISDNANVYTK